MESSQAGHDAPVSQRDLDDYDRWPLAEAISNTIQTSPSEWSTRIAVYGRWGEGKTTLINFLSQMQAQVGNVVITFKAWNVSGEEDLWESFVETLRVGFQRAGIRTGITGAARAQLKRLGKYTGAILK